MVHTNRWTGWTWLALAGALALAPAPAAAEGFFDLYLGAAFPQDSDVDTGADDQIVSDMIAYSSDVEWETSPSFGIRGGYWFDEPGFNFLGIGLDLSYYRAFEESDFASLDVYAMPMTPLLMLRIPIAASEEFPGGRIQPYGAIGPGFTFVAAHADTDELRDNFSGLDTHLDDFEDATFDVGLDARAGLAIQLARPFAIYGEYRYTYIEPEFEDDVKAFDNIGPFETEIDIEPELATHHLVFGVSFRF
jgi:hypothetical protein